MAAAAGAALLTGCAVQPVPGQTSIISRLPSDYTYAAPVDTQPVPTQSLQSSPGAPPVATQGPSNGGYGPNGVNGAGAYGTDGTDDMAAAPPMSAQERQRYADIDKQVQREQSDSMAAENAARGAWYAPAYYPSYYPAYYPSYYPAYYPAYSPYYASPVIVGGYYGGWGRGGCCYHGGSRWSVGVGFSSGWGW
jgi:hypothetical protein